MWLPKAPQWVKNVSSELFERLETRISIAALEDLVHGVRPQLEQGLELCEHAGLRDGRTMVALVARRLNGDDELRNGAEPERGVMMQIIEDALPAPDFGRLVNIRLEDVVAVVSSDADTGRRVAAARRAHPWCRSHRLCRCVSAWT
jgi:hypothetical protein